MITKRIQMLLVWPIAFALIAFVFLLFALSDAVKQWRRDVSDTWEAAKDSFKEAKWL